MCIFIDLHYKQECSGFRWKISYQANQVWAYYNYWGCSHKEKSYQSHKFETSSYKILSLEIITSNITFSSSLRPESLTGGM
jgi:hypothetical protein